MNVTFEQALVKFFYQQKVLSMPGIGRISLSTAIPDADMVHKNRMIPVEGLSFEYNIKADVDPDFVTFFAQQRGKIRPLAYSDIESQFQLVRQLMNIGKPFEVDGIGVFSKESNSTITVKPGYFVIPIGDQPTDVGKLRERAPQEERKEVEKERGAAPGINAGAKKLLAMIAILLVLLVSAWFAWSKFAGSKDDKAGATPASDSTAQALPQVIDTAAAGIQPVAPPTAAVPKWKAYFRTFDTKQAAEAILKQYKNQTNPVIFDSVNLKLYVVVESAVADTTRSIDSLKKVYIRPITLERIP